MTITHLLVANRGEIAVRVLRTAAALGLRTTAVFSDADADAPHVHLADEAVRLGPAPAVDSYLDVAALLAAAARTGADAVHPGYGFLSENAAFARAVEAAGLVWVGPPAAAIETMGDKAAAKRLLGPEGVPLLPGHQGADQSDAALLAAAADVGLPLMVKAAAGGGGRGMRLVASTDELAGALTAARREALAAFGDGTLLLERALSAPRHVEVQVLGDTHGTVRSLGVRDCSVQRRHQKVVEEAGDELLPPAVRAAVEQAAVTAARAVDYVGAGTVEFLLDPADDAFWFLEMNTRLQVEHPVTELVTGLDLVAWQLRVAAGEALPDDLFAGMPGGHAIEVRLYAEDPAAGHLPQTGTLLAWRVPDGVRVDTGVEAGSVVTPHYDPMLAKLVAHGPDRETARRRLADALDRLTCLGVTTNRTFLARVLRAPGFAAARPTTRLLADVGDEVVSGPGRLATPDVAAVAGHWHLHRRAAADRRSPGLGGWTNTAWLHARQLLRVDDDELHDVTLHDRRDGVEVRVAGAVHLVTRAGPHDVVVDGHRRRLVTHHAAPDRLLVHLPDRDLDLRDELLAPPAPVGAGGAGVLVAPMHGRVVEVLVALGDSVTVGTPLATVEAMKMEHVVLADVDGTVAELGAGTGSQVATGDLLVRVEAADPAPASDEDQP
jgi:geranyl-CoA carboxylase alpha subunit